MSEDMKLWSVTDDAMTHKSEANVKRKLGGKWLTKDYYENGHKTDKHVHYSSRKKKNSLRGHCQILPVNYSVIQEYCVTVLSYTQACK